MSTPSGAVAPFQGAVVSGQVVDRKSEVFHGFLNIIRDIVRNTGLYHDEEAVLEALRTIDSYSRSVLASDHSRVQREHDAAPIENVRDRIPPAGTGLPVVPGPAIDYRALAEAMYAVQQAHAQQAQSPEQPQQPEQPEQQAPQQRQGGFPPF